MDLQIMPAPIAYVRHLVDVEDDSRAKFDQLRVLAQNTLQVLSGILLSDCLRLGLVGGLANQPSTKRMAVGDFANYISEAASGLMTQIDHSYVPELVRLYGERTKEARQRRERMQRIVQNRNRDAHTASLAQTRAWLSELLSEVDAVLEELDCLRAYIMVAVRNIEPGPDRLSSKLNGLRCQGFSERYLPIKQPIYQIISRSEVILIKVDRSDWLSLRPWFLYFWDDNGSVGTTLEELALLNLASSRYLSYVGLISGAEYRVENEWRSFTMYESETAQERPATDDKQGVVYPEAADSPGWSPNEPEDDETSRLLKHLTLTHENIITKLNNGSGGKHHLVSVRTPVREVAVATVDQLGRVQLFKRMLQRAVGEGLLQKARLETALSELGEIGKEETDLGGALLDIGNISERVDWLGKLAHYFSNW